MMPWSEHLNVLADLWADCIWRGTWQGGMALGAVWLICRLFPKLPPLLRYGLWCAAFLKLLVAAAPVPAIELPVLHAISSDAPASVIRRVGPEYTPSVSFAAAPPITAPRPGSSAVFCVLWLAGCGFMLVRLLRAGAAAARLRRRCQPIEKPVLAEAFVAMCRRAGVGRKIPLLAADGIASPLLIGALRPAIVLPTQLIAAEPIDRLKPMMAHELAHHLHRDLLANLLPASCEALFFFHPLVWLAARDWRLAQESACDQAALEQSGCGAGDYGQTLLRIASSQCGVTAGSSAVIAVCESRKTLERRLSAMRHFPLWSRPMSRSLVVALVLMALVTILPWRVVAQPKPAPEGAAGADRAGEPSREKAAVPAETVSAIGLVTAATIDVLSSADTAVRQVHVKEGARVKKGEVLIELDSRRAQAAVAEAKAQYQMAAIRFKRQNELHTAGGVNPVQLDEAATAMEIAKSALDSRSQDLGDTRLTAPFDGIVSRVLVRAGQGVSRNAQLCTLVETGALVAEMNVPQMYYPRLKSGGKIDLVSTILPDQHFSGEIIFVAPQIDAATATILVKASVSDPKEQLRPGMSGTVKIELGQ
jgi:RND family efflux transporter MFP subunit